MALPCVVSACGRLGLTKRRAVRDHDGGQYVDSGRPRIFDAAPSIDAVAPAFEGGASDAVAADRIEPPVPDGSISSDATPPSDAVAEVHDAPVAPPDCRCPADDFYLDADLGGTQVRLPSPFHIGLYCDETAPQLANPPCGSVFRLSACAGPQNAPPCLYVAVDGQTPVVGFFLDATGQTFELVTGKIELQSTAGRLAIGTFSATYAGRTSEAVVTAVGTFHACTTLFQPCGT